ncbi:Iqck [Phodopus roborovskii]|uniref:Iqck protein n=1 Tax=Phodopus roborovskii TaxID=109678 RepID=A0AAU9ZK67_PHORO|nr:Iqck [Phodopus roborovskii]
MAAPRQVSNRSVQREEAGGSVDSAVATRTPVPAVWPWSLERLVSPAQVAEPPGKNLWEQICEGRRPPLVTPLEELVPHGFNMEHYLPVHPFPVLPPEPCPPKKAETVEPKTCSPRDYLEMFIFPVLLPGMANLLHQAKREKCFEVSVLVECPQNPKRAGEPFTEFFSIPFVEEWLKHHPRPPIPLSLLLTEEEAAISIQSFWRAYLVMFHVNRRMCIILGKTPIPHSLVHSQPPATGSPFSMFMDSTITGLSL